MAFGDNFNRAINHFDRGLIVNRVGRDRHLGSHSFYFGHGAFRVILMVQVRKQRKVNHSQPFIDDKRRIRVDIRRSENGS